MPDHSAIMLSPVDEPERSRRAGRPRREESSQLSDRVLACAFRSFCENGLPLGLQLVAGKWKEGLLCRAGYAYQQVTDHHIRRPALG